MYTGFLLNKNLFLKNLQIDIYYVYHKNEGKKSKKATEWRMKSEKISHTTAKYMVNKEY